MRLRVHESGSSNVFMPRFEDIPWPPRSTGLRTCDFFLWGHAKINKGTYFSIPNEPELKEAIKREVTAINGELLKGVTADFLQ